MLSNSTEVTGEAKKMQFTPRIEGHNSSGFSIAIDYDSPEEMSVGGAASFKIGLTEVGIFKSKDNLKPLTLDKFEEGKPDLGGALPPLISDLETAESFEENTSSITEWIETFASSNFFIGILIGGSMGTLWGMIRALQMTSLSALIRVKIPTYLHIFLSVCVVFASMDIFSGEEFYESNMHFLETKPPGE